MRAWPSPGRWRASAGGQHFLHVNTGFAASFVEAVRSEPGLALHAFPPKPLPEQVVQHTLALLRDWRPDLFVVDTFPRGVAAELVDVLEAGRAALAC